MSGTDFALDVTMPRRRRFSPRDLFAQGAPGAWYDPSDLGSMAQNSDGSGPATVDAPVGWIRDKSGGGRHAVQPVAGLRPMLRQAGSLFYLAFDGTDDFLSCPFALSAYPLTLMAAGRVSGAATGGIVALGGGETLYKLLGGGGTTTAHAINRNAANLSASTTISATADQVMTAEILPASAQWTRLRRTPVREITGMEGLSAGQAVPVALPVDAYAIDIDANGDGWVRVTAAGSAPRVRVSYRAGLATAWGGAPEVLRQGIVRLASHLYAHRDGAEDRGPPAAVTALWRPWRRVGLR